MREKDSLIDKLNIKNAGAASAFSPCSPCAASKVEHRCDGIDGAGCAAR
jgi:hypothetical protein